MAVLLVAVFPILLLISSPMAWGGVALGIVLLYHDNRRQAPAPRQLIRAQIRRLKPRTASVAKRGSGHLPGQQAA
jgi:hypothetical protein